VKSPLARPNKPVHPTAGCAGPRGTGKPFDGRSLAAAGEADESTQHQASRLQGARDACSEGLC
jgi:hypothetical protein